MLTTENQKRQNQITAIRMLLTTRAQDPNQNQKEFVFNVVNIYTNANYQIYRELIQLPIQIKQKQ